MSPMVRVGFVKKETGEKFVVEFDNLEKVDEYIKTLFQVRNDLQAQLEQHNQSSADKKMFRLLLDTFPRADNDVVDEILDEDKIYDDIRERFEKLPLHERYLLLKLMTEDVE